MILSWFMIYSNQQVAGVAKQRLLDLVKIFVLRFMFCTIFSFFGISVYIFSLSDKHLIVLGKEFQIVMITTAQALNAVSLISQPGPTDDDNQSQKVTFV